MTTKGDAAQKVFISYSSRDRIDAIAVRKIIEDCGGRAWMDVIDISPTAKLGRELEQGVDSVDVLCLLLSPTAVASPWVREEIARARAAETKGVKVLPVLLRPTAIPDTLADLVAIDATRGVDDPSVSLRLRQFFAGDVPEGVRLDAINRAELADRKTRSNAETALLPLRKELERVWDQPLSELTLEIDQDTWPDASGSVLEIAGHKRALSAPPGNSADKGPHPARTALVHRGRIRWSDGPCQAGRSSRTGFGMPQHGCPGRTGTSPA